ncbi:MAG: YraN family protein, partial [Phycisphaerae bacterium]|nr:YraN family protein [Phycisphaerae bacterium]
ETVNRHKQKRLIRAAKFYLQRQKQKHDWPCRFDVVAMILSDGRSAEQSTLRVDWIQDAFQVS